MARLLHGPQDPGWSMNSCGLCPPGEPGSGPCQAFHVGLSLTLCWAISGQAWGREQIPELLVGPGSRTQGPSVLNSVTSVLRQSGLFLLLVGHTHSLTPLNVAQSYLWGKGGCCMCPVGGTRNGMGLNIAVRQAMGFPSAGISESSEEKQEVRKEYSQLKYSLEAQRGKECASDSRPSLSGNQFSVCLPLYNLGQGDCRRVLTMKSQP